MPVSPNEYSGEYDEYITFNYADERDAYYADDDAIFDRTEVQIHMFTRKNPQPFKNQIRRYLRKAGFTISNTVELYENDSKINHIVVECVIYGKIEN